MKGMMTTDLTLEWTVRQIAESITFSTKASD